MIFNVLVTDVWGLIGEQLSLAAMGRMARVSKRGQEVVGKMGRYRQILEVESRVRAETRPVRMAHRLDRAIEADYLEYVQYLLGYQISKAQLTGIYRPIDLIFAFSHAIQAKAHQTITWLWQVSQAQNTPIDLLSYLLPACSQGNDEFTRFLSQLDSSSSSLSHPYVQSGFPPD